MAMTAFGVLDSDGVAHMLMLRALEHGMALTLLLACTVLGDTLPSSWGGQSDATRWLPASRRISRWRAP